MLASGTLKRYIDEFSIIGFTSNPTIFDHAIARSHSYDEVISRHLARIGARPQRLLWASSVPKIRKPPMCTTSRISSPPIPLARCPKRPCCRLWKITMYSVISRIARRRTGRPSAAQVTLVTCRS
ncbi:MAG: hypothetical protein ACYCZQ_15615 [Burkholderiales bacterium]